METPPMEVTFKTSDPIEIKRLVKATDMALAIWEIKHNSWREFKHTDYEYEKAWEKFNEVLSDHNIDIDDLIE